MARKRIDRHPLWVNSLRLMRSVTALTAAVVAWIGLAAAAINAQAPLHDSQYPDADIAYGASLYGARCVTCHGTQGDAIGGGHLRRGPPSDPAHEPRLPRLLR